MATERKHPRGPLPLRDAIRTFWRDSGLSRSRTHERVFRAWSTALGQDQRKSAVPVRFQNGELWVEVESTVHLQELKNFTGDAAKSRANVELGSDLIRKVVFKLRG